MDEESILEELSKLEERVDSLIQAREELRAENAGLTSRVADLESQLQAGREERERLIQERNLVRSRIDGLLTRLSESAQSGGTE